MYLKYIYFIFYNITRPRPLCTTSANTSPSISDDGRSFVGGDETSGKRSNSSNERADKSATKGRLRKGSKGHFGSKGSLLSKGEMDNEGSAEYHQASPKFHPKELHQNTTLQLVKKGT